MAIFYNHHRNYVQGLTIENGKSTMSMGNFQYFRVHLPEGQLAQSPDKIHSFASSRTLLHWFINGHLKTQCKYSSFLLEILCITVAACTLNVYMYNLICCNSNKNMYMIFRLGVWWFFPPWISLNNRDPPLARAQQCALPKMENSGLTSSK